MKQPIASRKTTVNTGKPAEKPALDKRKAARKVHTHGSRRADAPRDQPKGK